MQPGPFRIQGQRHLQPANVVDFQRAREQLVEGGVPNEEHGPQNRGLGLLDVLTLDALKRTRIIVTRSQLLKQPVLVEFQNNSAFFKNTPSL